MNERGKPRLQIVQRAQRAAALIALLVAIGACSESPAPTCPEQFNVGEACSHEGMECVWQGSLCGVVCRCSNQPGGFFWECQAQMCSCVCPCGRSAINSCEALECAQTGDPCPDRASALCAMLCKDSGVPDGGADGGQDSGSDGGRDSGSDGGRDGASDAAVGPWDSAADLPLPELRVDYFFHPRFDR